jgi:hypothetical protein
MDSETIYLEDRRLRQVEWLNRGVLALSTLVLADSALSRLATPSLRERIFAGVELAACALLVAVLVIAWRRRKQAPTRVGWVDVVAAAMLFSEWGDRLAHSGKWFSPVLLTALLTLAAGVGYSPFVRLQKRRRFLRVGDEGIRYRLSWLHRFKVRWEEVDSLDASGDQVRIRRRDGREHRIDLRRLDNRAAVTRLLAGAGASRGLGPSRPT